MLLKRCESMTRQPQCFNELKPDDDSFQPPSCPAWCIFTTTNWGVTLQTHGTYWPSSPPPSPGISATTDERRVTCWLLQYWKAHVIVIILQQTLLSYMKSLKRNRKPTLSYLMSIKQLHVVLLSGSINLLLQEGQRQVRYCVSDIISSASQPKGFLHEQSSFLELRQIKTSATDSFFTHAGSLDCSTPFQNS